MKKCGNKECYNNDKSNSVFCSDCLTAVVSTMNCEDLYDIFIQGNDNIHQAIEDGEAHGILTHQGRRAMIRCKNQWFKLINDLMMKKIRLKES